jgi:hypothetical protein
VFDYLATFNIIDQVTAEGPNGKTQAVGTALAGVTSMA